MDARDAVGTILLLLFRLVSKGTRSPGVQLTNLLQAIPHAYEGEEPDVYKSYAIPARSIVIANVWCVFPLE